MKNYKIVNDEAVQLIDGPFVGVTYRYGAVVLEPDEEKDELRLKFEYNVLEGDVPDPVVFKQYIGDILYGMIEEQLARNQIVYTGGVDAD